MSTPEEPPTANVEGTPTLTYEVWYYDERGPYPANSEGLGWVFIGYRVLSLRQVRQYLAFGYSVERIKRGEGDVARGGYDRGYTPPLFPRLGATETDL